MQYPPYRGDGFFGRDDLIVDLVGQLRAPNPVYRCLMVEGAPSLGKTWLLRRVAEELRAPTILTQAFVSGPARVCYFDRSDLVNANQAGMPFEESPCAYELLSKLWASTYDLINPQQAAPAPFANKPLPTQLYQIVSSLNPSRAEQQVILVVDGIDEIEVPKLELFERQFAAPLFENVALRLLCSRRAKSTEHRWRELKIKRVEQRLDLPPYDGTDAQLTDLFRMLGAAGSPASLRQLTTAYAWKNPGVNFLLLHAIHQDGKITSATLRECLDLLLTAILLKPLSDQTRRHLGAVVSELWPITDNRVRRREVAEVLAELMPGACDLFIGELQQRGAARVEGIMVSIHADIVELCRELEAKGERYGHP